MQKPRKAPPVPARTPVDDAAARPWVSIARVFYLCETLMARRLGALGVRTAEHEILANLLRDPGIAQQTLARRCFTAKSHISALLAGLEERGWVRRDADLADARAKQLFLTPAGERIAARTAAVQADVVAAMAESVPPETLAEVTATMGQLSERLQVLLDETL